MRNPGPDPGVFLPAMAKEGLQPGQPAWRGEQRRLVFRAQPAERGALRSAKPEFHGPPGAIGRRHAIQHPGHGKIEIGGFLDRAGQAGALQPRPDRLGPCARSTER